MGTLTELQELFASLPPYEVDELNFSLFGILTMMQAEQGEDYSGFQSPIRDIVRPEDLPSYQLTNLVDGARVLMTTNAEPVSWVTSRKTYHWLHRIGQKAEARARRVVRQQQRKRRKHRAAMRRKRRGVA